MQPLLQQTEEWEREQRRRLTAPPPAPAPPVPTPQWRARPQIPAWQQARAATGLAPAESSAPQPLPVQRPKAVAAVLPPRPPPPPPPPPLQQLATKVELKEVEVAQAAGRPPQPPAPPPPPEFVLTKSQQKAQKRRDAIAKATMAATKSMIEEEVKRLAEVAQPAAPPAPDPTPAVQSTGAPLPSDPIRVEWEKSQQLTVPNPSQRTPMYPPPEDWCIATSRRDPAVSYYKSLLCPAIVSAEFPPLALQMEALRQYVPPDLQAQQTAIVPQHLVQYAAPQQQVAMQPAQPIQVHVHVESSGATSSNGRHAWRNRRWASGAEVWAEETMATWS